MDLWKPRVHSCLHPHRGQGPEAGVPRYQVACWATRDTIKSSGLRAGALGSKARSGPGLFRVLSSPQSPRLCNGVSSISQADELTARALDSITPCTSCIHHCFTVPPSAVKPGGRESANAPAPNTQRHSKAGSKSFIGSCSLGTKSSMSPSSPTLQPLAPPLSANQFCTLKSPWDPRGTSQQECRILGLSKVQHCSLSSPSRRKGAGLEVGVARNRAQEGRESAQGPFGRQGFIFLK